MQSNQVNSREGQEMKEGVSAANRQETQDTGKDDQNGSAGEDEQAGDVNNSDIDAGKATGTDGRNNEKADNTPENARKVRDNDTSEGEE